MNEYLNQYLVGLFVLQLLILVIVALVSKRNIRLERKLTKLICPNCGRARVCTGKPESMSAGPDTTPRQ